jgi:hypothetical protein
VDRLFKWWVGLWCNIPGMLAITDLVGRLLLRQVQVQDLVRKMANIISDLADRLNMNSQDVNAVWDKYFNQPMKYGFRIDNTESSRP